VSATTRTPETTETRTETRVETPTLRRTARRIWPWIALVVVVVIVAVVLLLATRTGRGSTEPLAADNPGPAGSQALVEVLRQHGVTVVATHSLDRTEGAVRDRADTTVLVSDPDEILTARQHARLDDLAADLVLVAPGFSALDDLVPGVALAGQTTDRLTADCDLTAVQKAGTVSGGATIYDTGDAAGASCLRTADGAALVRLDDGGERITVLGAVAALQNGTIADDGNAALALNLLGQHRTLVWYLPGEADLGGDSEPSLADLTPPWVTPLAVLLVLAAVATMLWRGRRLGRVVVEDMPVVVRASETMEGRARLYERANARIHALDAIRIGTIARLGRLLGMPRSATVHEVADAVAAVTGRPRPEVAGLLVDTLPAGDADLVALSDALQRLEHDVAAALR
jgi:hypothetical protein